MAGAKADVDAETGDGSGVGSGGGGLFSEQMLIDKLNRLNNSATSIESILSPVSTFLHGRLQIW
jgi:regulator of Ty1 transposition protein 103